ncbi:MAG TPA: PDZ domain-containing protein [Gemmatimonadaceae bacterium]|nr:PDZ domain-containing protein [Gemmatimonadaceae bacterium]
MTLEDHSAAARMRWTLAAAVLATLLAAQTALASTPLQTGGGATAVTTRRQCAECAMTDAQKRAREALVERLDSLRWEIENRRLSDADREVVAKAMARTVKELDAAYAEAVRQNAVAAGQRETTVQRRTPQAQAFAYSYETAVRTRGYIGVTFDGAMAEASPPNPDRIIRFFQYPKIALVEGNSPAERAGVMVGDTVLALNGDDLREREFAFAKLLVPNAIVTMRVRRAGNARDLKVKVGETPEYYVRRLDPRPPTTPSEAPLPRSSGQVTVLSESPRAPGAVAIYSFGNEGMMGLRLETVTEGLGKPFGVRNGVLVLRAAPATPAYTSGLRDGDVVIRVGSHDVATVREFRNALSEYHGEAKLSIVRDRKRQDVTLRW